jgi:hypothetical protein
MRRKSTNHRRLRYQSVKAIVARVQRRMANHRPPTNVVTAGNTMMSVILRSLGVKIK